MAHSAVYLVFLILLLEILRLIFCYLIEGNLVKIFFWCGVCVSVDIKLTYVLMVFVYKMKNS